MERKIKRTTYCVFCAGGTENVINEDANANIIFTIKNTKLYVLLVTLSARDNQKLSKLLSKGFQISVYWNECKTKHENKNTTNEYRHFLKSNFVGVNRFVLVYTNEANNAKILNARKHYLRKGIIKNYNVIVNGKNFFDQPIGMKTLETLKR